MKSIIGIYDENTDYAERLFGFINSNMNVGCSAVLFESAESALAAFSRQAVSILLIDEKNAEVKADDSSVWILTETPENSTDNTGQHIYKYMNANELIGICLGWSVDAVEETSIYTVFCPGANSKAEKYAKEKASLLALSGKTLFISWEMFGGFEREPIEMNSLSELLYYAHGREKNVLKVLSNLKSSEGFYYLAGVDYYEDLWHYRKEEIKPFLELLKEKGGFQYIVVQLGFMSETVEGLMEASEEIYLLKESSADKRYREFLRQFKYAGRQEIITKLREVMV